MTGVSLATNGVSGSYNLDPNTPDFLARDPLAGAFDEALVNSDRAMTLDEIAAANGGVDYLSRASDESRDLLFRNGSYVSRDGSYREPLFAELDLPQSINKDDFGSPFLVAPKRLDDTGTITAIEGNEWRGLGKRYANMFSGGTLFPTDSASFNLFGTDTIQNKVDVGVYNDSPLFGSDSVTHGDLFNTVEIASAVLGVVDIGLNLPRIGNAIRNFNVRSDTGIGTFADEINVNYGSSAITDAEAGIGHLVRHVDERTIVEVVGSADFAHELPNALRFGEIVGGGRLDLTVLPPKSQGVEGLFTPSEGEAFWLSLKNKPDVQKARGVLTEVARNVEKIKGTSASGNSVVYVDIRQSAVSTERMVEFIQNKPTGGLMNMPNEGVVNKIYIDTKGGTLLIDRNGLSGY